MRYLPLFARICLCLIFFQGAFGNFTEFSATQERMAEMGLPLPALLLAGNIVFQLLGAISLLVGYSKPVREPSGKKPMDGAYKRRNQVPTTALLLDPHYSHLP